MRKNEMVKRLFLFILTASIVLTMQGLPVMAETLPLENRSELPAEQPEDEAETEEEPDAEAPENPESSLSSGVSEPTESLEEPDASKSETSESSEPLEVFSLSGSNDGAMPAEDSEVTAVQSKALDSVELAKHIVPGLNPEQAVVNLFDYWQYTNDSGEDSGEELGHDWEDTLAKEQHTTYNIGISKGHLLRFGYRETGKVTDKDEYKCSVCGPDGTGYYGGWNENNPNGPYKEIVKPTLGDDGFPSLNFTGDINDTGYFGKYTSVQSEYLTSYTMNESLAYLFSPDKEVVLEDGYAYKASYQDVQGLFQVNTEGYYSYNSKENFAEFDAANRRFILYDAPGVADEENGNYGQFFPFNKAEEVFDGVTTDGRLNYENRDQKDNDNNPDNDNDYDPIKDNDIGYKKCYAPGMNHYLGMTLEVPFLQPVGGALPNNESMCFKFSGDDDVWIFIDGVLVADLGGLHPACTLEIDFATGVVTVNGTGHTLLECFQKAYGENNLDPGGIAFVRNEDGTTSRFADNTVHTLEMFYLERGNIASNLSLSFNLQPPRYNQIKKVDQNGNAVENVRFELYPAEVCKEEDAGSILCNSTISSRSCYVRQKGTTPLLTITTGPDGIADFTDYSFPSTTQFYILKETAPPEGYRSQPVDIVLEYYSQTAMLSVANRWETGAYASFTSYVNEQGTIYYGKYQGNGVIESTTMEVKEDLRQNGLILAVPMLQRGEKNSSVWLPLYGSNLDGFHTTVTGGGQETVDLEKALLEAALNQCLYDEGWYLEWNAEMNRLEGCLTDLPGRADRYLHANSDGDMQMAYILIAPEAFDKIGIKENSSEARYKALKRYVKDNGVENTMNALYDSTNVSLLNAKEFVRVFRSLIYISNEQRELRVVKVDKNGVPLNGAEFGIYESMEDAQQNRNPVAAGVTANVDGEDGILIFKPQPDNKAGYAEMIWANASNQTYYLKEISAPDGYEVNETVIPIVIGIYSIYADAGTENDGVSVMAGVGQLYRTMAKYASDGDVNITLRDITAIAQKQDSGQFVLDGWQDTESSGQIQKMDLHYGLNSRMGMDYGLHNEASEADPLFTTDTGFLRVRVIQNTEALQKALYDDDKAANTANWDNLQDVDLTALFSLLNVVVVEDRKTQDPDDDSENTGTDVDTDRDEDSDMETDTGSNTGTGVDGLSTSLGVLIDRIGTPQTGDDSLIWWWASLSGVSFLGIGTTIWNLVLTKRKQQKQTEKEKPKKQPSERKPKKQASKGKKKKRSAKADR